MNVLKNLSLKINKNIKTIYFGIPDNNKELDEMYSLRYKVYKEKGYFNKNIITIYNNLDKDKYDLEKKCYYFIAKIDNRIIGCIRIIVDKFLPIEKECFDFIEPLEIAKIPRDKRIEIGRLVIIPYDRNHYLPRNIVLFFLISCVADFSELKNFQGGYAFITKQLYKKLKNIKFPFHIIEKYKKKYPVEGLLYPYFYEKDDIIPIFFLQYEVKDYVERIFKKKNLFIVKENNSFFLKSNVYIRFLKMLKII